MRWLIDRLRRLRWMAAPLAAYVTITLVLPGANGAIERPDFALHAVWVLGGCATAVAIAFAVNEIVLLVRRARRRSTAAASTSGGTTCEP